MMKSPGLRFHLRKGFKTALLHLSSFRGSRKCWNIYTTVSAEYHYREEDNVSIEMFLESVCITLAFVSWLPVPRPAVIPSLTPDPVLWAAAQMGILSRICLMIGDTTIDIRLAKLLEQT
jgi:hypothetical protein